MWLRIIAGGFNEEEKQNGLVHTKGISMGLPRLHMVCEGMALVAISRFNIGLRSENNFGCR